MRRARVLAAVTAMVTAAGLPAARAQRWDDATAEALGLTHEWSNRVELADLDGDGWIDLLFANGGDATEAGTPEPQRVFRNLGNWAQPGPHFAEITDDVFGAAAVRLSRVILAGDLDGDGGVDVFVGGAHGTASGLFLRRGTTYDDVSATHLPAESLALADAALADLDGDGDLDLVAADWGGPPLAADGRIRMWVNDGAAHLVAVPPDRLPASTIAFATDLEVIDVDDDADLDVVVGCLRCERPLLWLGDGTGRFSEASDRLPAGGGARDVEAMDVDADGDLDLATADDGTALRERILVNTGGRFEDRTATLLPGLANTADVEDGALAFADVDSDRDVDLLVGSRTDPDRLLRNDGAIGFVPVDGALALATPGTLGLALADLDRDGRLDVVQAQGDGDWPAAVQLAAPGNRADTAVAVLRVLRKATPADRRVIARVHDRKSAGRPHDFRRVVVEIAGPGTRPAIPMRWMGEHLWTAVVPDEPAVVYRVCATDVAGNPACARDEAVDPPADAGADAVIDAPADPGGCCDSGGPRGAALPALGAIALLLRRRRAAREASA